MPPVLTLTTQDSRLSPPVLRARLAAGEEGRLCVRAPAVGLYRGAPAPGTLVAPGASIGALEILGVVHHLLVPDEPAGLVVGEAVRGIARARRPVAFDELLFELDPTATAVVGTNPGSRAGAADPAAAGGASVFRAPTSGRFYSRPGPGKPPFVSVGAVIEPGQTVGLIEVMKTFSRIHYGGDGLPPRARLVRILVADESDIAQGDPLLEVEAVSEA